VAGREQAGKPRDSQTRIRIARAPPQTRREPALAQFEKAKLIEASPKPTQPAPAHIARARTGVARIAPARIALVRIALARRKSTLRR